MQKLIRFWQNLRLRAKFLLILLVGIVALALCPVAQYGTQLIVNPEIRDPNFDFVHLFANVVWGNTQVFLPISLVMIGGWLIDRENTHDTMKNLLTVPAVSAVWPLQRGRDGAHGDAGGPPGTDARGDPPAGGTGGGRGADHLPSLYAHGPDFWADAGRLSGRLHPGLFPGVLHFVL